MLLRASLDLPVPAATVAHRLSPLPGMDALSDDAYSAGLQTLTRVGPFGDTPGLSKKVLVETLEPREIGSGVRIPFRWVATGRSGAWFPALDADLEVTAADAQNCTLSINAAYTPPLGAAGAGLDRIVLHRAARATMRSLLRGLARAVLDGDQLIALPEVCFYPDVVAPPA